MKNLVKLVGYTAATLAILIAIFWGFQAMLGYEIELGMSQGVVYALIVVAVLAVLAFIASMF